MPTKYTIKFNRRYLKDLEKIPFKNREQIRKDILSLADDPRPDNCKKLKGCEEDTYRIRCGNYRVVYSIRDDILLVLIVKVGHRKDVYR